jgi:hypothetical protein
VAASWLSDAGVERWERFPVDADPRPVVLLGSRVRVEDGFVDGAAKQAWLEGAIEVEVELQPEVVASLPSPRPRIAETRLVITGVERVTDDFVCDRA